MSPHFRRDEVGEMIDNDQTKKEKTIYRFVNPNIGFL
jgi:hypothetical protein